MSRECNGQKGAIKRHNYLLIAQFDTSHLLHFQSYLKMIRGRNNLATSKQGLPAGQVLSKKGKNAKSQSHLKNTRISKLVLIAITLLLLVAVSPSFLHNIGHDHQDNDSIKTPSSKPIKNQSKSNQKPI